RELEVHGWSLVFGLRDFGANAAQSDVALAECLYDLRVELLSRLLGDFVDRIRPRLVPAVRPVARDRIERVRDREHAGTEWDLVPAEAVRVAVSVPALVVRAN